MQALGVTDEAARPDFERRGGRAAPAVGPVLHVPLPFDYVPELLVHVVGVVRGPLAPAQDAELLSGAEQSNIGGAQGAHGDVEFWSQWSSIEVGRSWG